MGLNKFKLEYYKNQNFNLKKQLEKLDRKLFFTKNELDMRQKIINNKLIQQKEFINYLEDEIKNSQKKWGNKLTETGYLDIAMTVRAYRIILQKYKEIIGDDK